MQRITVAVHATDPISRAGVAGQLRHRPEVTLVDPAIHADDADADRTAGTAPDGAAPPTAVAVVVAEALDEPTTVLLRRLHRTRRTRQVLVVPQLREGELGRLVECGVTAVVWRAQAGEEGLLRAILAAANGDGTLPPELVGRLMTQLAQLHRGAAQGRAAAGTVTGGGLSERERDVLRLVAEGLDSNEIASRLCYSQRTVKNVLYGVMTRMNLRNRPHAVAHALREGYL
ncbi:LuxR C-terminal-related transcriptional regulator [Kitasatospora sp. NPDC058965]|uniref:helix-turn-helix transcriptional regulator n=1 Tax=Kitasatospora sp. NPDC058965 TaxID=3346682 RepID=UPI00369DAF8B